MREVIRPFNARMRVPLKPEIRHIYTDGDTVIVFFDAKGTARDGKPYVQHLRVVPRDARRAGLIAASAFFDSLEFNELWARVAPSGVK